MTPSFFRYWGKCKTDDNDTNSYHLLVYHSFDVAAAGYYLLDLTKPLIRQLAKQLDVNAKWLQTWLVFCLAIHDLGKFARAFQGQKTELSPDLVPIDKDRPYTERHDSLGFNLWDQVLHDQLTDLFTNNQEQTTLRILINLNSDSGRT
jgi:CRISPR-associated endonuclease/helicase Cas3